MQISLNHIPVRDILHYLGWRGMPVEPELMEQIAGVADEATGAAEPRVLLRRFLVSDSGTLAGTSFLPQGQDVRRMLDSCHEVVLLAATLGAKSERMLLRAQAQSPQKALLLDAALSAAIEAVCDQAEQKLRASLEKEALHLTDRFSPGYGDMPMAQTKEICEVLGAGKAIGLTVSKSGIMIPRKSVTAVMGISRMPVKHRSRGCEACSMRERCTLCCKNE